jgi:hypothetical protein
MPAELPLPGIPGVPGVSDLAAAFAHALERMVSDAVNSFTSWVFAQLSEALLATTSVPLGDSFDGPWRAMLAVSAVFALPILLAGVIHEVLLGRPDQALRRGVLYPLAIGPVLLASRAVIGLLVAVVQGACGLLVEVGLGSKGGFAEGIDQIRQTLGVATGPADPVGASSSLVVVLIAGVLAFIIWVELAVRAALVLLLAAFVPLALAGMFWQATSAWTRRILECLAAVLLAPLVITMVMVLATATLTSDSAGLGEGINRAAIALALLFLGTLGLPLTFRLIPHVVEAAVVAGAGASVARSARQRAGQAGRLATAAVTGAAAPAAAARLAAAPAASGSGPGSAAASLSGSAGFQPSRPASPPSPPAAPAPGRASAASRGQS